MIFCQTFTSKVTNEPSSSLCYSQQQQPFLSSYSNTWAITFMNTMRQFLKWNNLIHNDTSSGYTLLLPASRCFDCLSWLISHSVTLLWLHLFSLPYLALASVHFVYPISPWNVSAGICCTLQWVLCCCLDSLGNILMNKALSNRV